MFDISKGKFQITNNIVQSDTHKRKIIETIIYVVIINFLVSLIPFIQSISFIVRSTCSITIIIVSMKGIYGMSISQAIIAEIKFRRGCRKLHLRSIEYVRKKTADEISREDKSIAEYYFTIAYQKYKLFIRKYRSDDDSEWIE